MAPINTSKCLVVPGYGRKLKSNAVSDPVLWHIIAKLPPRFYGVCPFSLTSSRRCPVEGCSLAQVCDLYNDEFGQGCDREMSGSFCRQVAITLAPNPIRARIPLCKFRFACIGLFSLSHG